MSQNNIGKVLTLAISIASAYFVFPISTPARAETTLERIERTGTLRVAIREDAPPFGYLNDTNNLNGFCLDFVALLEKELLQKLSRNTIIVRLLKSRINNRYELIAKDLVDIECGPNTISDRSFKTVQFSTPFFVTGTQFIVKEDSNFDLNSSLENTKLGVIKETTTAALVAEKYPQAEIVNFRGANARKRGIRELQQGKIDGMASDGILLRAEAQQQGLSTIEYPLIPENPLTCDRYGMILNAPDPEWKSFVDAVINSTPAKTTFNSVAYESRCQDSN